MPRTLLFIDADNQPPTLATPTARLLKTLARDNVRAVVAGNGVGDRVQNWEHALRESIPDVDVCCHVAPARKQAADVRLMFELGSFFHGGPDPATLILVLSRDDLLLAAIECLVERGHSAMIAVGASSHSHTIVTDLPVVVLPMPHQVPVDVVQAAPPVDASPPPAPGNGTKIDPQIVVAAISKIRQSLNQNKQGGYAASAVGQVLAQLGHDKATRSLIVRSIPNLKESGVGSEKRLIF